MSISRMLYFSFSACLLALLTGRLQAATATYDFTYSGTGTYPSLSGAETVTGNGYFTYTYTPGSTAATLTDFSFSDTFTNTTDGNSSFTYAFSDVASSSVHVSTVNPYGVASVTIDTSYLTGTNTGYGPTRFVLQYSGVTNDSTAGNTSSSADYYATFSSGGGTVTPGTTPTSTPEPASLGLTALGAFATALLFRRRRAQ